MATEAGFLDINLLGREYRVACPPEQQTALLEAAAQVDLTMREIASKAKNSASDKIAVMAALNIAHERLVASQAERLRQENEARAANGDLDLVRSRIASLTAALDAVLGERAIAQVEGGAAC